ncbi:sensor histidine kinase [Streptomyces sp. MAR4 CNX-425]|uniref:sensor histidine kinase n=1 Tax=Streptomyces sp. MAR4 CNX-425 TaxID=3406343 RepID=UPI003B501C76
MKRFPRSLRNRLSVTNVGILAVGLVAAACASLFGTYTLLVGEVDATVRQSRDTLAETPLSTDALQRVCQLADAFGAPDGNPDHGFTASAKDEPFVLLDPSGRIRPTCTLFDGDLRLARAIAAAVDDPGALADSGELTSVTAGGHHYRAGVARLDDGSYAISTTRYDGVRNAVRKLFVVEAVFGALLLLLLAVVSSHVARRRLRPLEDMVETASAISEGDLSRRVDTSPPGGSEVEQLRDALNAMLQQVEGAMASREEAAARQRQFLADASHELRTPLATVLGYLQLYDKGILDDAEAERALTRVGAEARRMSHLVDELLALARLDQHPARDRAPVDLAVLVRDAAADLRAQQPHRPVTADAPAPAVVVGDEAQLRQVVGNLLANVRTHTPEDAACTLTAAAKDGAAVLRIADTGPGMRPEDAARVFDRFFRADPGRARAAGGSGLGMSIVRAVVEAHDGEVALDTAPAAGMAVTIRLPRAQRGGSRVEGSL